MPGEEASWPTVDGNVFMNVIKQVMNVFYWIGTYKSHLHHNQALGKPHTAIDRCTAIDRFLRIQTTIRSQAFVLYCSVCSMMFLAKDRRSLNMDNLQDWNEITIARHVYWYTACSPCY